MTKVKGQRVNRADSHFEVKLAQLLESLGNEAEDFSALKRRVRLAILVQIGSRLTIVLIKMKI